MSSDILEISIEDIIPDPNQPRKNFDEEKLKELAESIKQHGILQPILVRPIGNGKFEIVHGERRWRACKLAGMATIKAIVRDINDREKVEIQLVENLQREDLNPIEEAETFKRLIDEFGWTHEELAKRIGKSRPYVTNKLRLLDKLSSRVQEELRRGSITEGHARLIVSLPPDEQERAAKTIIDRGFSIRETEKYIRSLKRRTDVSRETSDDQTPIEVSNGLVNVRDLAVWKVISPDNTKIRPQASVRRLLPAYIKDLKMLRRLISHAVN